MHVGMIIFVQNLYIIPNKCCFSNFYVCVLQFSALQEGPNGSLCLAWSHNQTDSTPYLRNTVVKKKVVLKKPVVKVTKEVTWHELVTAFVIHVFLVTVLVVYIIWNIRVGINAFGARVQLDCHTHFIEFHYIKCVMGIYFILLFL